MTVLTVTGLEIPGQALTFDGFRDWYPALGEGGLRANFIDGSLYLEMTQDYESHASVVLAIQDVLRALARELDLGRSYAPPSWISHAETHLSTEPDGFLLRWESLESGRVRLNPTRRNELLGRPDMALEVVSASSVKKDLDGLLVAYAAAGVPEYWIADAREGRTILRILVLGRDRSYRDQEPDAGGWLASPTWSRSFRLARGTDRLGMPEFLLETR